MRRTLESKASPIGVGETGVKVHIHTDHPGEVLDFCASLGDLSDIRIDNTEAPERSITLKPTTMSFSAMW